MHSLLHLVHNLLAAHISAHLACPHTMLLHGVDAFPEQIEQWGVQQDMADLAVVASFMLFVSLQSHLSQA